MVIGDLVVMSEEDQRDLWQPCSPGIIVNYLDGWGYMVNWPFEGYTTSEKDRHLIKIGHVEE